MTEDELSLSQCLFTTVVDSGVFHCGGSNSSALRLLAHFPALHWSHYMYVGKVDISFPILDRLITFTSNCSFTTLVSMDSGSGDLLLSYKSFNRPVYLANFGPEVRGRLRRTIMSSNRPQVSMDDDAAIRLLAINNLLPVLCMLDSSYLKISPALCYLTEASQVSPL